MPQARTAGSSTRKSTTGTKSTAAKAAPRAKAAAAKAATPKSAAAKPATAAKRTATRSAAAKAASPKAAAAGSTAAKESASAAKGSASARPKARVTISIDAEGPQLEALAERVRKLNEKIIEVGREAGQDTLANYEKALKSIQSGIQQGKAKDEIEWIQHLAASQAKFVRELTDAWAKAARERLK